MVAGSGALSQKGLPAVPDDMPSLGELGRRIEAMRLDIKEDIHELAKRLDAKVSIERYQLEREAHAREISDVVDRLKKIEDARQTDARQRVGERKWLLASFVFPTVAVLVGVMATVLASVWGWL